MSFNPTMARLVAEVRPLLGESPTVVELGNQTFRAGNILGRLSLERKYPRLTSPLPLCTADFYRVLGFSRYEAIDITTKFGSKVMDLNYVLLTANGYTEEFDLVTNNGTGEHVFNQAAVFENCHNLCKAGGYMLHVLPFQGYVNHGMYGFHPKLFNDLARANGYKVERMALADRDGMVVGLDPDFHRTRNPGKKPTSVTRALAELREKSRRGNDVQVVALLRQTTDEKIRPFRVPIDGRYVDSAETPELRERYAPFGQ